ncbi:MAG: DUF1570 domain-containing protein [Pirellulales bacterium]|nr:DUF1570 domain-containing protein [Pirellulales bacterium]
MRSASAQLGLALIVGLTMAGSAAVGEAASPSRRTIELEFEGRRLEGMPLAWSKSVVYLLARDGRLWEFPPRDASDSRQVSSGFQSYPATIMRAQLEKEFGPKFEVSSTGHYLVVHPSGKGPQWSRRFEDLYRSFVIYFQVRDFQLKEPEFPMVAIVFPNQREFMQYAARDGSGVGRNVLGYYSPMSNRVALYDSGGGKSSWEQDADTIIHEATHQSAFNTGIHTRFAPQPKWVIEGLGTMFEASGVWDSRNHTRQNERVNRGRFGDFRAMIEQQARKENSLEELIASDERFSADPAAAYAEAWALTYYLVETQPRKYAQYLKRVIDRTEFQPYPAAQRMADFTAVFGDNFRLIDAQFLRFIKSQK